MRAWGKAAAHASALAGFLLLFQWMGWPVRIVEAFTFAVAITALQRTYAAHPTHTNDWGES